MAVDAMTAGRDRPYEWVFAAGILAAVLSGFIAFILVALALNYQPGSLVSWSMTMSAVVGAFAAIVWMFVRLGVNRSRARPSSMPLLTAAFATAFLLCAGSLWLIFYRVWLTALLGLPFVACGLLLLASGALSLNSRSQTGSEG